MIELQTTDYDNHKENLSITLISFIKNIFFLN